MAKPVALALVFVLFSMIALQGKDKSRAWQTGKVLDSDQTSRYAGQVGTDGDTVPVNRVEQTYVIEIGEYMYVAKEGLRWRWSKPAQLTVNGPVKVAVEKDKLYLIGEDGKEHKAEIIKKVLKESKPEQSTTKAE